jgi:hypothetical protein
MHLPVCCSSLTRFPHSGDMSSCPGADKSMKMIRACVTPLKERMCMSIVTHVAYCNIYHLLSRHLSQCRAANKTTPFIRSRRSRARCVPTVFPRCFRAQAFPFLRRSHGVPKVYPCPRRITATPGEGLGDTVGTPWAWWKRFETQGSFFSFIGPRNLRSNWKTKQTRSGSSVSYVVIGKQNKPGDTGSSVS